jgi:hypothetical protein
VGGELKELEVNHLAPGVCAMVEKYLQRSSATLTKIVMRFVQMLLLVALARFSLRIVVTHAVLAHNSHASAKRQSRDHEPPLSSPSSQCPLPKGHREEGAFRR